MMGNLFELHPRDDVERRGCQGCHGPGSVHVASGEKKTTGMLTFRSNSGESVREGNDRCLNCHERGEHVFWRASTHALRGLACTDCHTIMRKESAQFQLTSAPLVTPLINPFVVTRPETQVKRGRRLHQAIQREVEGARERQREMAAAIYTRPSAYGVGAEHVCAVFPACRTGDILCLLSHYDAVDRRPQGSQKQISGGAALPQPLDSERPVLHMPFRL
jgi:hypothetical protein